MKKFRVHVTQQVEEFIILDIKAKSKKKAWKKAEKLRIATHPSDWHSTVTDIDFSFERIIKEYQ